MYKKIEKEYQDKIISEFLQTNKKFSQQPIVKSFLAKTEYRNLLALSLDSNDPSIKKELDYKFKQFYRKARIIKYISNLIYFYSIDFDKKVRRYSKKNKLILDQPVNNDSEHSNITLLDKMSSTNIDIIESLLCEKKDNLEAYLEDEKIINAFQQLTIKQKEILKYIYIHELKNKEIALLKNETPQNISQIHQGALKKLRSILNNMN
ncbi:sigma-70 family RNA polymerase sigma factor (plasmid) [Bacillus thuringiensis]|nr:sigma-70 family RNA polymerase sigma factor [Bacillus thuringiensis]